MRDVLYLAWRYLAYHRLKTTVLVLAVATIVYLPMGLNILVIQSGRALTARAEVTPMVLGAKGSPLELVLRTLYFAADVPEDIRFAEVERVDRSRLATAIPLNLRCRTKRSPIVGTTLDYFDFRGLELGQGRAFGMLGECVLGARAAKLNKKTPGDSLMSSSENLFDLAGVYPLKMKVVGVLQATGTPDDDAVFVDLKTTWVIVGLAHGHVDLSRPEAGDRVLGKEGNRIVANDSVLRYNEITPDNVASFHFHGNPREFPVTSIICVPSDEMSAAVLQGRYLGDDEKVQFVDPPRVMADLLQTVLTIRRYILLGIGVLAVVTCATMGLVFVLSWQLRRRELETIDKIGGSRTRVFALLAMEILVVIMTGTTLACVGAMFTTWFSGYATQLLIRLV